MSQIQCKIYVDPESNKTPSYMRNHIKVGSKVIVVDGSYMLGANTQREVNGIYFRRGGLSELLTVVKINRPFPTRVEKGEDVLVHYNNCKIKGSDGAEYYCSLVNIRAFT